jgi:hypothetical protein
MPGTPCAPGPASPTGSARRAPPSWRRGRGAMASGTASRPSRPRAYVVDGEQAVAEGDTDVALHRGVGEVALEPALDEGGGEDVEEGVAHLEVGLGVLETDRVDLVWHRAAADGALAAHLGEVAHRDVGPDVGAHVVQHPVEPGDVGIELGLPVVALDLGGQRVPRQAQALDEGLGDRLPVGARDGREVRAIGAGRAVELAEEIGLLDPVAAGAGGGRRGRPAPCPSSSASPAGRGCGRAGAPRAGRWPSSASFSTSALARGSQTSSTAPLTMSA